MARLTACFALSAVLLLATGICSGTGQPIVCPPAPAGLPALPPTRIIIKSNPDLSITVRASDSAVVLARTRILPDRAQLWYQYFARPFRNEFALLVDTGTDDGLRAIQIPENLERKVKLVPFNFTSSVNSSILWTRDNALDDLALLLGIGFYKIRSVQNSTLLLDGLLDSGRIRDGTDVGAINETHADNNVLWRIDNFLCIL